MPRIQLTIRKYYPHYFGPKRVLLINRVPLLCEPAIDDATEPYLSLFNCHHDVKNVLIKYPVSNELTQNVQGERTRVPHNSSKHQRPQKFYHTCVRGFKIIVQDPSRQDCEAHDINISVWVILSKPIKPTTNSTSYTLVYPNHTNATRQSNSIWQNLIPCKLTAALLYNLYLKYRRTIKLLLPTINKFPLVFSFTSMIFMSITVSPFNNIACYYGVHALATSHNLDLNVRLQQ